MTTVPGGGRHDGASGIPPALATQPRALRTLSSALDRRRAHAFLLSGSYGAGTIDAALWIARRVLCPAGGNDGCESCGRIDRRVHPDLHWVVPEGQQVTIEQLRGSGGGSSSGGVLAGGLIGHLTRTPFEAAAQVAVIEDAHTLGATNAEAANSILKVLEEPPGDVVFVLLAETAGPVLATIRSRVIEVRFPPVSDHAMLEYLTSIGAPGQEGIARLARGDLARARDLVAGGPHRQRYELVSGAVLALCRGEASPEAVAAALVERVTAAGDAATEAANAEFDLLAERMPPKDAARFAKSKEPDGREPRTRRRARRAFSLELRAVLADMAATYRDLAAVSVGADATVSCVDRLPELQALRASAAAVNAVAALDAIEEIPGRITTNVDLALAMSAVCAELASLAEGRMRSRRTIGAPSRTATGYEVSVT